MSFCVHIFGLILFPPMLPMLESISFAASIGDRIAGFRRHLLQNDRENAEKRDRFAILSMALSLVNSKTFFAHF